MTAELNHKRPDEPLSNLIPYELKMNLLKTEQIIKKPSETRACLHHNLMAENTDKASITEDRLTIKLKRYDFY